MQKGNQKFVVQKYGGSSVADAERLQNVATRVTKKVQDGYNVVVVVSAMGKTTDNLIKLAKQVTDQPDAREMDMLLTTGEQVSAALLAMALQAKGIRAKSLNGFQAKIKTTGNFTEAKIQAIDKKKILQLLTSHQVLVVTGFQGIADDDEITTLGRGGSDTSAVALAADLQFPCEIFSDVAGIYTTDPKLFPKAKKVKQITYDEMLELAASGAKVLHSRAVEIAKRFNISIYCGSSFSYEEGSFVVSEDLIIEKSVVSGLTVMDNQTQVIIHELPVDYGIVRKVFEKVATAGLNIDMISIINNNTHLEVSFTIIDEKKKHLESALKKVLEGLPKYRIEYITGFCKVSVVGVGMKSGIGVASDFFTALKNIPFRLVTTSEIKISCLIETEMKQAAVEALAKKFKL
ncbi:MAG: aspartate kinase [Ignavibacteria bacterium]|nr:aspartate kinase [Ignavibacteria bacterium]